MSLAAWYLHKVDQSARLADDAAEPAVRWRHEWEREAWRQILAKEIGADVVDVEAVIAMVQQQNESRSAQPLIAIARSGYGAAKEVVPKRSNGPSRHFVTTQQFGRGTGWVYPRVAGFEISGGWTWPCGPSELHLDWRSTSCCASGGRSASKHVAG